VRVDYHPKVSVKSYVVHGTSASAIFDEIRKRGPGPWAGEAAWQISYDTVGDYSDTSSRCRLQRVIVHTDITLTLPRWDPSGTPDLGARSYWRNTSATLERHERGHQRLVEQASQRLVRELSRIRSALSCGQLYDRGDHVANRVFSDLNRANRRYDAITDHGLNQSAAA
jgi:predicted secreted Zn-dependent protease